MQRPNPNQLDAALALIDLDRWGAKGSIVSLLRWWQLGDPDPMERPVRCPYRLVAAYTGLEPRYARRLLCELVAESVLVCAPGAGRRPDAYLLNPDVASWEAPWRKDPWDARNEILEAGQRVTISERGEVVTRWSAAQGPVVTRRIAAEQIRCAATLRGTRDPVVTRRFAAQAIDGGATTPSSLFLKTPPPGGEEEEGAAHPDLGRCVTSIRAVTGRLLFTGSRPYKALNRALQAHGLDPVAKTIGELDRKATIPAIEAALATINPQPVYDTEHLQRRAQYLAAMVELEPGVQAHQEALAAVRMELSGRSAPCP